MPVELRLMRYVVTVADEGSFQAAARALHMAQPPLSRQIRVLEQQLGTPLFHRRPTRLTEAGHEFVRTARKALAAAEEVTEATRRAAGRQRGVIGVGYGPTTAYDEMPRVREAVAVSHPDIRVQAAEIWGSALEAALRGGRLDVALGRHLPRPPGYRARVLARHRYVVGIGADHPAGALPGVSLAALRGQPLRLFPRHLDPGYYDAVVTAATSTGLSFDVWENPVPDLRNIQTRRSATGFMLLPACVAHYLPGIVTLEVRDALPPCELQLVWREPEGERAGAVAAVVAQAISALTPSPSAGCGSSPPPTRAPGGWPAP